MAVLQSLSAYQMYRQKVRRRVHAPDVILFLFKDQQFPRSVAFSLRELAAALSSLPRNGGPLIRLGELRRMLAVFEVTRLDVAALLNGTAGAARARRIAQSRPRHLVSTNGERRRLAATRPHARVDQEQAQTQTQPLPRRRLNAE
jgi:hypothetical protein